MTSGSSFTHGHSGYANHKCRCDVCKSGASAYRRAYREANGDRLRAANSEYHKRCREERLAAMKIYRTSRVEDHRIYQQQWRAANPDKIHQYNKSRRALRLNAPINDLTNHDWLEILNKYGSCAYCGSTGSLEQEHALPLSRGGSHTASNVVPACRGCNASKGAKTLEEVNKRGNARTSG
jgi:5-methylcytosine-specific restriction endonuclease McrA